MNTLPWNSQPVQFRIFPGRIETMCLALPWIQLTKHNLAQRALFEYWVQGNCSTNPVQERVGNTVCIERNLSDFFSKPYFSFSQNSISQIQVAASQSLVCPPGMCRSLLNAPHCPFGGFIYLRSIFDLFALNRSNRSPGVNFWSHLWLSTAIDPPGLSPTDWSANSAIVHIIGELQIDLFFSWVTFVCQMSLPRFLLEGECWQRLVEWHVCFEPWRERDIISAVAAAAV